MFDECPGQLQCMNTLDIKYVVACFNRVAFSANYLFMCVQIKLLPFKLLTVCVIRICCVQFHKSVLNDGIYNT